MSQQEVKKVILEKKRWEVKNGVVGRKKRRKSSKQQRIKKTAVTQKVVPENTDDEFKQQY